MINKSLKKMIPRIKENYLKKEKLKVSLDTRETASTKTVKYTIYVLGHYYNYKTEEDREKDLIELKNEILTVFPEKK